MAKRRNKGQERQIAAGRVSVLLGHARSESLGPDRDLANRYATLARRIAMRYQLKLLPQQRMQVCRSCGAFRSATTTRVRIRSGKLSTTCLACGHTYRRPLGKTNGQQQTA